jgi:hypothetical protein
MTGEYARKVSSFGDIFRGLDIISSPIVEAFLLQNKTKTDLLLDEFMQVYLYPDTTDHTKRLSLPSISPSARVAEVNAN